MAKEKDNKKSGRLRERIAENFLTKRQVFIWGAIHDKSCEEIVEKLLFLENDDPGKPIYLFINSPGGVISAGMAVYDVMKMISSPVYTVVMGMAASMGAILFAAGEKGHRYVFEHAKVMIHQPLISGQIVAPAIDIKIHAEEIKKTREELNRILAEATGQALSKVEQDTDRDYYMKADEAVSYGIADKVLKKLDDLQTAAPKSSRKSVSKKKTARKTAGAKASSKSRT